MNYAEAVEILKKHGQTQLLEYYGELSEAEKELLLNDIQSIDFSVLQSINAEKKPLGKIAPPKNRITVKEAEDNFKEYEKIGIDAIKNGKVCAVLLAGGQGTRLGFDKPKGMYDLGETRKITIFELLMQNVKAVAKKAGAYFRLFIMTNSLNNGQTVNFFKENDYFGYPEDKISFFVQRQEAACDKNGKIFLSEKHRVALSPNGNGGWYSSLIASGADKIIKKECIEWINVFGVDNVLQKICDPVFIGATIKSGCNSSAKVVKKVRKEEKVGLLCEEEGEPTVVEYFELPENLAAERDTNGDLKFNCGIVLNYLFKTAILDKTVSGNLPYHLAEKKIPHMENGEKVYPPKPNGYKFETLIVDMIKLTGSCLAYEAVREREFAPVKNKEGFDSPQTAKQLLKLNGVEL